MNVEEKAKRIRELAEQMAEVLSDGPEVCRVQVFLHDGQCEDVEAQMAFPHEGALESLGQAETRELFYNETLKSWQSYRHVTIGGVTFWVIDSVPAPVNEEVPA